MHLHISAFISIVLAIHALASANWDRHTIKNIFSLQNGSDRNNV